MFDIVMAHHYKVRHYYVFDWVKPWSDIVMAHFSPGAPLLCHLTNGALIKVCHYYVQEWVKPWSNIVMAHFSPGAPLLFRLLMAHHMYSAPLVSILSIAVF